MHAMRQKLTALAGAARSQPASAAAIAGWAGYLGLVAAGQVPWECLCSAAVVSLTVLALHCRHVRSGRDGSEKAGGSSGDLDGRVTELEQGLIRAYRAARWPVPREAGEDRTARVAAGRSGRP